MHYRLDQIPYLTPEQPNGSCFRSIKAGNMEIGATWVTEPMDTTELYKGLPNDCCPCEHYGYVFYGAFRIRYLDGHEEEIRAGEMYYIPKEHYFIYDGPCHHLEINPHDQLQELMVHFNRQIEAANAAAAAAATPAE